MANEQPPRWKQKVVLTRDNLGEILDALSDARDPYGREAGELELRLSKVLHDGDRVILERRRAAAKD